MTFKRYDLIDYYYFYSMYIYMCNSPFLKTLVQIKKHEKNYHNLITMNHTMMCPLNTPKN